MRWVLFGAGVIAGVGQKVDYGAVAEVLAAELLIVEGD
jgi:hypothetical protein